MFIVCGFLFVYRNCGPEIQLPVEGEMISTAGCEQENLEKEDDVNQIFFDEPSTDPPLETQTTDPPSKV